MLDVSTMAISDHDLKGKKLKIIWEIWSTSNNMIAHNCHKWRTYTYGRDYEP